MSFWNEELTREVALSQWRTHQAVLAIWTFFLLATALFGPGRDAHWSAIATALLALVIPPALILEWGRRKMNRDINEQACKWIWQK